MHSTTMNFLNELNTENFPELKKKLKKEYNLQVKEFENLYNINIKKNKINNNPQLNFCNGIILEKETNKTICNIFSVVKEYPDSYNYNNFEELCVEEAIDGTLIKVYYYNDQWRVATNRCIDAKTAFWICNQSFYDLFMEAAKSINFAHLNKTYSYAFILQHPKNRNVTKYNKTNIVYIYSYDNVNNVEVVDESLLFLDRPKKFKFASWDEMMSSLSTMNYSQEGYMIYNKNREITKIVNPNFKMVKDMKGNTPDMVYRCLVLYKLGKMDEFLGIYPEYTHNFNYIKTFLYNLSNKIYMLYTSRHVKKQPVSVPPHYDIILNHLHKDYIQSNNNNPAIPRRRITKKLVYQKILGYSPMRIYSFFGTM